MRLGGIVPLGVKRNKYHSPGDGDNTAKLSPESQTAPETRRNLLKDRNLVAGYFGHIWAEDFTYLLFQGTMYYLATIIDLYSREVVGWALSDHHDTDLIVAALLDAVSRQEPPGILHQDQGSEYCSGRYDVILLSLGIEASFSDKGHPWENGFQESFYRYFKIEIKVKELDRFADLGELYAAIAKQLHYYNHERIHSALGMSPREFVDTTNGRPQSQPAHTTTTTMPVKIVAKRQKQRNYFQQMVTGVREWVFGKVGA